MLDIEKIDGAIAVQQLPVITEQLREFAVAISEKCAEINALECTEETVKECKKTRAELNKVKDAFEAKRKEVKAAIEKPYKDFEAVYKECVLDNLAAAEDGLRTKINAVETELKDKKIAELKSYYDEYAASLNLDLITFDMWGTKVGLSDTLTKLKKEASAFLDNAANDIDVINSMPDAAEVLAEYKKCLNLATAAKIVASRKEEIKKAEELNAQREAAETAYKAKEAEVSNYATESANAPLAPSAVATEAVAQCDKVYSARFTVKGTLEQLKELKNFMNEKGIEYNAE